MGKRMLRRWALIVVFTFLASGFLVSSASAAILVKIGYVDVEKVFQEYQKKKDLEAKLQAEGETKRQELAKRKKELEELQKEFEAQKLLLTEQAKEERQEEINRKSEELKRFLDEITSQMKQKETSYTQEILSDIIEKIKEIAAKEGYSLIFDKQALLYAAEDPELDLTQKIIDELNKEYRAKE